MISSVARDEAQTVIASDSDCTEISGVLDFA